MSRQSLTLRRPSSNPPPEAIAAFIGNDDDEGDPPKPAAGAPAKASAETTAPSLLRALPNTEASPAETTASSNPVETTSTSAPSFRRASRAVVTRRTRPARRRTTIYLDVDVAEKLAAVLVRRDQELSDTVNALVRSWLQNTSDGLSSR